MSAECNQTPKPHHGSGYVFVIVLYILLAVMLSSFIGY